MDRAAALLEASVQQTIADCGGDAVAAVRALLVAYAQVVADQEILKAEIAKLTVAVSPGFVRGRLRREGGGAAG